MAGPHRRSALVSLSRSGPERVLSDGTRKKVCVNGQALIAALLLGVLLPVSFSRPGFLEAYRMREHVRLRWNFIYTCGAFAAIGYVYCSTRYLLRPVHGISTSAHRALGGGALILFAVALAHHIPPLTRNARSRGAMVLGIVAAVGVGFTIGGFLAVDEIFAVARHPATADMSWAILLLIASAAMLGFSGFSPETRLWIDERRRHRRLARLPPAADDANAMDKPR